MMLALLHAQWRLSYALTVRISQMLTTALYKDHGPATPSVQSCQPLTDILGHNSC